MKGMFVKDMEIMRGNDENVHWRIYYSHFLVSLVTSAGPSFLNQLCVCSGCCYGTEYHSK